MREILTIIAALLVALLTAALAGPWFVDWQAQRARIEAQLSETLGVEVRTEGAIDLKLLPTPRLVLERVAAGAPERPAFRSGEVRFELAVAPLLRGELHFLEASLEAPELRIDQRSSALVAVPSSARLPEEVRFERIQIRNGRMVLVRDTGEVTLAGIDLDAEADSLAGPFKGEGRVRQSAGVLPFRFATGAREAGRMRLKLVSDEALGLPRMDLDGAVQAGAAGLASAGFDGVAILSGTAPLSWRATGPIHLDAAGATTEGLELRLGPDEGALTGTIAGKITSENPRADLSFTTRQIDLDRFTGALGKDGAKLTELAQRLFEDAGIMRQLPLPVKLDIQSPSIQLGGDALSDASVALSLAPGQAPSLSVQTSAPGRSAIKFEGVFEPGTAARFSGDVDVSARDLPRMSEWLQGLLPDVAERLRLLPFRLFEVKGRALISAGGLSASGLSIKADRSAMTGTAAYTRAVGPEPARVFVDLNAEALDVDGVPDLSTPGRALADTDLNLSLDARAIRVARFGQGLIDAGRIRLRLQKSRDQLRLEEFSLANLGGATVTATGDMRSDSAQVEMRVDAQRLGDLAAFARRVAPGAVADALAARATALSPARVSLSFGAQRPSASEAFQLKTFKIDGTVRDTRLEGTAIPDRQDVDLKLVVDGADAALVLRQFGLDTVPLSGSGRARVQYAGRGSLASGFSGTLDASVAGTALTFNGSIAGDMAAPQLAGTLRAKSDDTARLLRLLAIALPDVTQSLAVDLQARVATNGRTVSLEDLSGRTAGTAVSGRLALVREGASQIEGALTFDRASLPGLMALLIGPPQPARAGALWSPGAFAPGMTDLLPINVALRTTDFRVTDRVAAKDAQFRLRMAPSLLAIDDLTATLERGALGGGLVLRRDGQTASMSGALRLEGVPLERAGVSGLLSGSMTFTTTGANAAALAAGLAGAGKARINDFRFLRADPGAPARVITQADEGSIYISENDFVGALRRELARAPQNLGERSFDLNMAAGVLRLASATGQSLSLDLRTLALEARTMLTADPLPKDWSGPAPQLTLIDRDGARELDAGAFVNALAARAITKEGARIEALEADIRERAAFARRKRGLDFLHLREREIAAFQAEQARLAQEAERRAAAEEQRRVAEEERRRVQSAPAPVNILPPPHPPAPPSPSTFRAPPANVDPSAAGRY